MYTPWTPIINIDWLAAAAAAASVNWQLAIDAAVDANIAAVEQKYQDFIAYVVAYNSIAIDDHLAYIAEHEAEIRERLLYSGRTLEDEYAYVKQQVGAEIMAGWTAAERALYEMTTDVIEETHTALSVLIDTWDTLPEAIANAISAGATKTAEAAGLLLGWGLEKLIPVVSSLAADFGEALTKGIQSSETEGANVLSQTIKRVREMPELPIEAIPLLDEAAEPKHLIGLMILGVTLFPVISQIFGAFMRPVVTPIEYQMNRAATPYRFDPETVSRLWLRAFPSPEGSETWFEDLRDLGANEDRISAIKELAHYLPSPTEVMSWAAREVFEPELREKYQLDKFLPAEYLEWAAKVGVTDEVAKNYWAAHWVLPSLTNIVELWRRGILTKDDVDSYWTELDMVPWVREHLFKLFREVPTRVDVRRWWDMGTIDEPRLRQIYQALGYFDEDLEDYVLWTKVYTAFPDLISRYKNGWITEAQVRAELTGYGMPEARLQELWETKFKKPVSVERVSTERDLTKAEIYKGVKKGILTWDDGVAFLQDMGYDEFEAEYIIAINVEAAGSPETYLEFKRLIESYKRSQGMETREIPQEVVEAEKVAQRLNSELAAAKEKGDSQEVIDNLEVARVEAFTRLRELLILHNLLRE